MVQGDKVEVAPHTSYVLMLNYIDPTKPDDSGTEQPDVDEPGTDNIKPTAPDKDYSEINKPQATRPQTGINNLESIGIGSFLIIGGSLVYYLKRKKKMK